MTLARHLMTIGGAGERSTEEGPVTGQRTAFGHSECSNLSWQRWEAAEELQPGRGIINLLSTKLLFQEEPPHYPSLD